MRVGLAIVAAAAGAGGIAAGTAYGATPGWQTLSVLLALGLVTVLVVTSAGRLDGLRRQLTVAGVATGVGVAAAVLILLELMFVSSHDALFMVIVAGWALAVGGWSAWLLGRRALDRIAASEAARRDLVAAVSHDLRTPITALRLLAEAVDDEIVDPDTRREYVSRISTHVRALGGLIDDLFELSRLEAGDLRWSVQQVGVEELVAETVEAMRPAAEQRGVVVRAELRPGLRPARADPEQLQRVLFNLIQNAIRHTPADGSVVVRAEPRDGSVEIEVADTGEGIAEADRARVFDAFVQAGDRAARTDGGAGLGLAIARAIVDGHGGRIWLADAAGGTSVRFSVPLA